MIDQMLCHDQYGDTYLLVEDQTMSAHCRPRRRYVADVVAGMLMAAGVAACIYGTRYEKEGRIDAMAEFPVDQLLVDKHTVLAGNAVATTGEMTAEEILAASLACQHDVAAVCEDVCHQLRLKELALLAASACLLAALPTFVWTRVRPKRRLSPVSERVPGRDADGHAGMAADIAPPLGTPSGHHR